MYRTITYNNATIVVVKEEDLNRVSNGDTPLTSATRSGKLRDAAMLLAFGADINRAIPGGITPLHVAAKEGHTKIAELLVSKGAHIDAVSLSEPIIQWV